MEKFYYIKQNFCFFSSNWDLNSFIELVNHWTKKQNKHWKTTTLLIWSINRSFDHDIQKKSNHNKKQRTKKIMDIHNHKAIIIIIILNNIFVVWLPIINLSTLYSFQFIIINVHQITDVFSCCRRRYQSSNCYTIIIYRGKNRPDHFFAGTLSIDNENHNHHYYHYNDQKHRPERRWPFSPKNIKN